MDTLKELQAEYTTDKNGIIRNPGKFEGETLATPYFYDIMLNGEGHVIELSAEDHTIFDIESKYNFVVVLESVSGFVSLAYRTTRERAEILESGWYYTEF